MPVRNHITYIQKADGVARGTEDAENKAKAELGTPDPENADQVVDVNTLKKAEAARPNPNTKLDTEEKLVRATGQVEDSNVAEKKENAKKAEETTLKPEDVAHPETSQKQNKKK